MLRVADAASGRVLVDEVLKAGDKALEMIVPELEIVVEEVQYAAMRNQNAKFYIISRSGSSWEVTDVFDDEDLVEMRYDHENNAVIIEGYEHSVIIRKA